MQDSIQESDLFSKEDYEYFKDICEKIKTMSLNDNQIKYLAIFIVNPNYSAYDIHAGKGTSSFKYRYVKLMLRKLHELQLIKIKIVKKGRGKHSSKHYVLTDYGIFYMLKNSNLLSNDLIGKITFNFIQSLIINYYNSKIFNYLLFPFIKLDTIRSSNMSSSMLYGIRNYLILHCQKIYDRISIIETNITSDQKKYGWNYDKLEYYLKNRYNYDWLYHAEFDFFCINNQDIMKEKYYDPRNKNNYIEITFNKRSEKGHITSENNKKCKKAIPFIQDYLAIRIEPKDKAKYRSFSMTEPEPSDFILAIYPESKFFGDLSTHILLSADEKFKEALKFTKKEFDRTFQEISSSLNLLF
ncbi:MAG: hypothetical protein WCB31_11140 [Nitrososphaeraceae archaeon]